MYSKSSDTSKNSIQIKQDDKFFSKLLSKESSMANPSFRVYYGGVAVAVPFLWESQPGTPKSKIFSETTLPPLTPPPSYYANSNGQKPIKKHSRSSLLHILFPKMNPKRSKNVSSSSSTSSTLSSSSSWSSSSTFSMVVPITSPLRKHHHARSRFSSRGSSFDSRIDIDEESAFESPTSTLCFSISRRTAGGLRGCYGW